MKCSKCGKELEVWKGDVLCCENCTLLFDKDKLKLQV